MPGPCLSKQFEWNPPLLEEKPPYMYKSKMAGHKTSRAWSWRAREWIFHKKFPFFAPPTTVLPTGRKNLASVIGNLYEGWREPCFRLCKTFLDPTTQASINLLVLNSYHAFLQVSIRFVIISFSKLMQLTCLLKVVIWAFLATPIARRNKCYMAVQQSVPIAFACFTSAQSGKRVIVILNW